MQEGRSRPRWFYILVVVAALGYLAGAVALGSPPHADASGAEVVSWLRAHAGGVRFYVWTGTGSAVVLATIISVLRRLLPAPHRDVFLIGGIVLLATSAVQAWFWAGLALHADSIDPSVARSLMDVMIFWGPVLTGATMAMIGPVTLLALQRRSGLPYWLGIVGLIAFVEQAVETMTVFGKTGFTEPGGPMNLILGAFLVVVWLFAFAFWGAANLNRATA